MDAAGLVLAIVGALCGIAGVVVSLYANQAAKLAGRAAQQSADEAAEANGIARKALKAMSEANRIAGESQLLGEEANLIAERQAAQLVDHEVVRWRLEWDKKAAILRLVNDGADPARDVTVVVNGKDLHEVCRWEHECAHGDEVTFPLPKIVEQRAQHVIAESRRKALRERPDFHRPFTKRLEIHITWKSSVGAARSESFQLKVR